jgi:hypothetical protein
MGVLLDRFYWLEIEGVGLSEEDRGWKEKGEQIVWDSLRHSHVYVREGSRIALIKIMKMERKRLFFKERRPIESERGQGRHVREREREREREEKEEVRLIRREKEILWRRGEGIEEVIKWEAEV